ncbi:DUF2459 domain-containing protein [Brevundimonas goettingensis]|uniref:DUF2459 domain-containing protein n=1 Tax=Brevundimonas goettingensis TaxID=2774190 RepID=A0A975C485_9CAUL|nr:DUF2459 domain-containing protein [Brevundimonas goettingensis]QTC91011.1 DUF2459 domain-containing protein [Brevundimonas goettingensis]
MGIRGALLAGIVGALAALWTWTAPGDPALWPKAAGDEGVPLYLLDNGFHTDMVVPRAALAARPGPLAEAVATLGPGDWILIGWGDAKFYVDQSPIQSRLPDGARAFFRPGNPSVLMLRPETQAPEQAFLPEGRRRLVLSQAGFEAMDRRIEASLDLSTGKARVAATRPGDPVRFFASRETFSILHLCNHWAGEVLNAAGLPIRPVQTILSAEIGNTADRAADRASGSALQTASTVAR